MQTQSYGAEARGTTAKSEIIISEGKIGFPMVRKCDILIAMSQEALEKNLKDLKEDGVLLFDNSVIKKVPAVKANVYAVPATEIAEENFGQKLYTNMVILGALNKLVNVTSEKTLEKAIKETFAQNTFATNLQAYKKGREIVKLSP